MVVTAAEQVIIEEEVIIKYIIFSIVYNKYSSD